VFGDRLSVNVSVNSRWCAHISWLYDFSARLWHAIAGGKGVRFPRVTTGGPVQLHSIVFIRFWLPRHWMFVYLSISSVSWRWTCHKQTGRRCPGGVNSITATMPDQILAALNSSDKSELMNRSVFDSGQALFAFWGKLHNRKWLSSGLKLLKEIQMRNTDLPLFKISRAGPKKEVCITYKLCSQI